jgi:hypothetical protein
LGWRVGEVAGDAAHLNLGVAAEGVSPEWCLHDGESRVAATRRRQIGGEVGGAGGRTEEHPGARVEFVDVEGLSGGGVEESQPRRRCTVVVGVGGGAGEVASAQVERS